METSPLPVKGCKLNLHWAIGVSADQHLIYGCNRVLTPYRPYFNHLSAEVKQSKTAIKMLFSIHVYMDGSSKIIFDILQDIGFT